MFQRRHTGPDTISAARMATERLALAVERLVNAGVEPDPMFREFVHAAALRAGIKPGPPPVLAERQAAPRRDPVGAADEVGQPQPSSDPSA